MVPDRQLGDQIAMTVRHCARRHDEAAIAEARKGRNGLLDFERIARVDRAQFQNCPIPEGMVGSRRTAARATLGATCLSRSSHFPLRPYSNIVNPVALPPGRARLATKPAPTGS